MPNHELNFRFPSFQSTRLAQLTQSTLKMGALGLCLALSLGATGLNPSFLNASLAETPKPDAVDAAYRRVVDAGLMALYPDGKFHPDNLVDRATLAVVMNRAFKIDQRKVVGTPPEVSNYLDVPQDHWAFNAIRELTRHQIMRGYRDNQFFPDRPVSRAEGFSILAQSYGVYPFEQPYVDELLSQYQDAGAIPVWARKAMATVVHDHLIAPKEIRGDQKLLRPEQLLTRGDLANALSAYLDRKYAAPPEQQLR